MVESADATVIKAGRIVGRNYCCWNFPGISRADHTQLKLCEPSGKRHTLFYVLIGRSANSETNVLGNFVRSTQMQVVQYSSVVFLFFAVFRLQDALPHTDQYILRWESDWLVTLGKSVEVRGEGGRTHILHGGSGMIIDSGILTMPGRASPTRQTDAASTKLCGAP